jgi:hypothetical protein
VFLCSTVQIIIDVRPPVFTAVNKTGMNVLELLFGILTLSRAKDHRKLTFLKLF